MVGAQKAIKMASSLFPVRKRYSDITIMERTTSNIMKLIVPTFPIKFFNMLRISSTKLKVVKILLRSIYLLWLYKDFQPSPVGCLKRHQYLKDSKEMSQKGR